MVADQGAVVIQVRHSVFAQPSVTKKRTPTSVSHLSPRLGSLAGLRLMGRPKRADDDGFVAVAPSKFPTGGLETAPRMSRHSDTSNMSASVERTDHR